MRELISGVLLEEVKSRYLPLLCTRTRVPTPNTMDGPSEDVT